MMLAEKRKNERRQPWAPKGQEEPGESSKVLESLNAEFAKLQRAHPELGRRYSFSFFNVFVRPRLTFFYNYVLRGGFLDGHEGLLLHLYHSNYVSWKYAKAWERGGEQADRRP
jgi:hypothetical protein